MAQGLLEPPSFIAVLRSDKLALLARVASHRVLVLSQLSVPTVGAQLPTLSLGWAAFLHVTKSSARTARRDRHIGSSDHMLDLLWESNSVSTVISKQRAARRFNLSVFNTVANAWHQDFLRTLKDVNYQLNNYNLHCKSFYT